MNSIKEKIGALRVLPVVKLESAADAAPLADALRSGGLGAAEITFRTACAAEAIHNIATSAPDVLVGAGTVLTVAQVDAALDAGARFIVSPGLSPAVVGRALERGVPVFPGCVTPTEIEAALALGLDTVKFFPAEAFGGVSTIKALSAPYSGVKFIPTGGITLDNLASYLSCGAVLACGGSYMVKEQLIRERRWDEIAELARKTVETAAKA